MTNGYWVTQIIYVAARLGIADLLKDGPRTISALGPRLAYLSVSGTIA